MNTNWTICGCNKIIPIAAQHERILREKLPGRVIYHLGDENWPTRSFCVATRKTVVYADKLLALEHLKTKIWQVMAEISSHRWQKIIGNYHTDRSIRKLARRSLDYCSVSHVIPRFKFYKKELHAKSIFKCILFSKPHNAWACRNTRKPVVF